MSSLEREIFEFADMSFGKRKREKHGPCTEKQLNDILKAENPCVVVIKPHVADGNHMESVLDSIMRGFDLSILVKMRMRMSRANVFGLYGDLVEVMGQGEAGVNFVNGLVSSFIEGGEAVVYVVSGSDSYKKMKVTKKFLRDLGTEDRFRNVIHSSDDIERAIREINALLIR